MIKDAEFWERWKAGQIASDPVDYKRNLAMMEAMYEHARTMGVFRASNLAERLEFKIRLAKVLNGLRSS